MSDKRPSRGKLIVKAVLYALALAAVVAGSIFISTKPSQSTGMANKEYAYKQAAGLCEQLTTMAGIQNCRTQEIASFVDTEGDTQVVFRITGTDPRLGRTLDGVKTAILNPDGSPYEGR